MKFFSSIPLLFCLSVISCGKDDSPVVETQTNNLTIDSDEYELTSGIVEDYSNDPSDGLYNIDLTLLTQEFTINGRNYSGNGRGLYFVLFVGTPDGLPVGDYTYNPDETAMAFDYVSYFDNSTGTFKETDINNGTLTVTKSNADYFELKYEGTDGTGKKITALYNGKVNYIK